MRFFCCLLLLLLASIVARQSEQISIYPNPAKDNIYVSRVTSSESVTVVLRNLTSNQSFSLSPDPLQPARFDLAGVGTGVYIATISIGGELRTERIVVL
jgi:hypothetical protein